MVMMVTNPATQTGEIDDKSNVSISSLI
jgi:hypothetical protein